MNPEELKTEEPVVPVATPETLQEKNPLKEEVEKIENQKSGHTRKEKLLFTKKRIEQQLREEFGEEVQEDDSDEEIDKSKPLTLGDLERIERSKTRDTAVSIAEDSIADEYERKLVIHHLENTIKPSGNAQIDLANARAIVNAKRNAIIAEEVSRKSTPTSMSSGAGAPPKTDDTIFEPTRDEQYFMNTMGLSKEDILSARKKEQEQQK